MAKSEIEEFDAIDTSAEQAEFDAIDIDQEPEQESNLLEAAGAGIADYGTFGFSDEIGAAVSSLFDPSGGVDAKLKEQGFDVPKQESYTEIRDAERKRQEDLAEQHPVAYHGAGIAVSAATGAGALKSAKLAKLLTTKKGLAATGAVSALGTSKAELTGDDKELGKAALDVGIGATLGVVAPKALEKITTSKPAKKMKNWAKDIAFKSTNPSSKAVEKELRKMKLGDSSKDINTAGDALLGKFKNDEGKMVPILQTMGDSVSLEDNIEKALKQNSEKLEPLFQKAQSLIDSNIPKDKVPKIGDEFRNALLELKSKSKYSVDNLGKLDKMDELVEKYAQLGEGVDFNLSTLNELKRGIGDDLSNIDWKKIGLSGSDDIGQKQDVLKKMYMITKERIENLADIVSKGDLGKQIKELNKKSSNLIDAKNSVRSDTVRQNRGFNLAPSGRELMVGAGLVASGNPIWLLGWFAKKGAEKISGKDIGQLGATISAKSLNGLAKVVNLIPDGGTKIANEIRKAITLPVATRVTELKRIYTDNQKVLEDLSNQDKTFGDSASENGKIFNSYGVAEINELIKGFEKIESGDSQRYIKELQLAATKDKKRRANKLNALWQKPDFRKLIIDSQDEEEGEE